MHKVKIAYRDCALCFLKKLPIENKLLQCASATDPIVHKTKAVAVINNLHALPDLMPNVLNEQCREHEKKQELGAVDPVPIYNMKTSRNTVWT